MRRIFVALGLTSLCLSLVVVTSSGGTATLDVPKSPWPVCNTNIVTYCVSSVSVQAPGEKNPEILTWVPTGSPSPATSTPVTTTTTLPSVTTTTTTPSTGGVGQGQTEFSGMWTDATWNADGFGSQGFGGIYIEAEAANVFSNYMVFNVLPALQNSSNQVFIADQSGSNYQASLNPDDIVTVNVETGDAQAGVALAIANNFSDSPGSDSNGSTFSFTASAVPVPIASNSDECVDETGVAAALANELQVVVAPTNDPTSGFGVDGVSGKMYVESNGACELSTPIWDASTQSLSWIVGAPHFAPDGTDTNIGFYQAMIPGSDANLLWGLSNVNQAATELEVSETSSGEASNNVAVGSISVKNGNIIVSFTGFKFSSPHFRLHKRPGVSLGSPKKEKTITCERGKSKKRVTGVSPHCPSGFNLL